MYCINCRNCIQAHCSLLCAFGAGISKTSPYTATFMFYLWSKSIECMAAHLLFLIMEHNQRICQTMIFTCVNQRKLSFPGIYVCPWPTHLSLTFTRPNILSAIDLHICRGFIIKCVKWLWNANTIKQSFILMYGWGSIVSLSSQRDVSPFRYL